VAGLKMKGDLAELKVATDLLERGFKLAFPYGEDVDYDLICDTGDQLHRVQVKHSISNGVVLPVRCFSHSLTNGRIRQTKRYTASTIDWMAVYDGSTDRCFYIHATELGEGRSVLHLRLVEARDGQRKGIRFASDYEAFPNSSRPRLLEVEPAGLEPATFRMQTERSSN
jgi:hypothetical protein